jgi:chemotaxis response regulator CheB
MTATVHRLFIIGESLFAEAVVAWLRQHETIAVVGMAPDPTQALKHIPVACPDVILALTDDGAGVMDLCPLLATHPDLPIVRASLLTDELSLICHRRIGRHTADLLAVIQDLPLL